VLALDVVILEAAFALVVIIVPEVVALAILSLVVGRVVPVVAAIGAVAFFMVAPRFAIRAFAVAALAVTVLFANRQHDGLDIADVVEHA
jgi:hypothetical protein